MKHMLSVFFLFLGFALFAAEPGRVEGKAVFKLKSEYRHLLQKKLESHRDRESGCQAGTNADQFSKAILQHIAG